MRSKKKQFSNLDRIHKQEETKRKMNQLENKIKKQSMKRENLEKELANLPGFEEKKGYLKKEKDILIAKLQEEKKSFDNISNLVFQIRKSCSNEIKLFEHLNQAKKIAIGKDCVLKGAKLFE